LLWRRAGFPGADEDCQCIVSLPTVQTAERSERAVMRIHRRLFVSKTIRADFAGLAKIVL
jgi:hypothetical protein